MNDLITISSSPEDEIVGEADCAMFDSTGTMVQGFSIPTNGEDIVHGASFGAFQLIACSKEVSCLVELQYEVTIYNDANDEAVLTDVTIVSMDGSKAVLPGMSDRAIASKESLAAVYTTRVNVCSTTSFQLGILAEVSVRYLQE